VRVSIVATAVGLTLLAGCGAPERDSVAVARPARSAAPSASPAPTVDRGALVARSRAAMVKPDGYRRFGAPATAETERYDHNEPTSSVCNMTIIGENNVNHVANYVAWKATGFYLIQLTHGYAALTGKDAVEKVRGNAGNCTTWTERFSDGNVEFTFLETFDLGGVVAGTDASYARCDRLKFATGNELVYCEAYVAKGPLLSDVSVSAGSVQQTKAKLNQVLPTAVAALVAA
jgi:hypothetical protein